MAVFTLPCSSSSLASPSLLPRFFFLLLDLVQSSRAVPCVPALSPRCLCLLNAGGYSPPNPSPHPASVLSFKLMSVLKNVVGMLVSLFIFMLHNLLYRLRVAGVNCVAVRIMCAEKCGKESAFNKSSKLQNGLLIFFFLLNCFHSLYSRFKKRHRALPG